MLTKNQITDILLQEDTTKKRSKFITLSEANHEMNQIQINNLQKDFDLTKEQLDILQEFSTNPRKHKSIAVHAQERKVEFMASLPFEYEADFNYNKYFVLPYFDYRFDFFKDLYLLVFAKNSLKLYEVGFGQLKEVNTDVDSYKKISAIHIANMSVEVHGQNVQTDNDAEMNLMKNYIASISKELDTFLIQQSGRLLIASTVENIALLSNELRDDSSASFQLTGNFENASEHELLELLHIELDNYVELILKKNYDTIDFSASNELQTKPFIQIVSIANEGRIEDMYIGKLGIHDSDYTNPIAPLGANYIASEVLKLGGNIYYFPKLDFEFSDNNIAFRLRY